MKSHKIVAFILLALALYFIYANLKPFINNFYFWNNLGPLGVLYLTIWWLINCGFMLLVGLVMLVFAVWLWRKK